MSALPLSDEPGHIGRALTARVQRLRDEAPAPTLEDGDEPDELTALRADSLEAMRRARWHAAIPQRFHRACLADFDGPVAKALHGWAAGSTPGRNLVLFGPVGVGKSWAAVAACREAHWRGLEVRFWPIVELLDALRPGGPETALADLSAVERLILDDVGSERPTDWTAERLFALLNRRWLECLPTIVTSNLEPDDLCAAVGERTFSRLVGNDSVVVRMAGSDRRRRPRIPRGR